VHPIFAGEYPKRIVNNFIGWALGAEKEFYNLAVVKPEKSTGLI